MDSADQNPSYVLATATLSTVLSFYHSTLTGTYRKKSGVPYPNAYASAEECANSLAKYQFNCAQRAHANFSDWHPSFLVQLLVAGLAFPQWSAGLGVAWCVARLMYARGYVREKQDGGKGRYSGIWWYIPHLGLMGMAGVSAWRMVMG